MESIKSTSNQVSVQNGKALPTRTFPTETTLMALNEDACVCVRTLHHVADNLLYLHKGG